MSKQPYSIGADWPEIGYIMQVSFMFDTCIYCIFTSYGWHFCVHSIACSDGGVETWSCLKSWSWSRLGLGPRNLGLGLGLVLFRSQSRSKQLLVETTKTSNILTLKKLIIFKMDWCKSTILIKIKNWNRKPIKFSFRMCFAVHVTVESLFRVLYVQSICGYNCL